MARELEFTIEQIGAGQSAPFLLPNSKAGDVMRKWTLTLKPTAAGTASIEQTGDPELEIETDPGNVQWFTAPSGVVAVATQEVLINPANAIRINVVSGNWKMHILGEL